MSIHRMFRHLFRINVSWILLTLCCSGAMVSAQEAGGTLVFAANQEPSVIDPLLISGQVNEVEVVAQIFETLVYRNQQQEIYAGVAATWQASENKKIWTFAIKPGITFHNGDPLDAAAVVAVFEFARTNDTLLGGGKWSTLGLALESTVLDDNGDVVVTFKEPRPDLLIELADPGLGISNVKYIESTGQEAGFKPVGSGPFQFKEWVQGSRIVLERNPDWTWGSEFFGTSGPAYLDEVVFRFIPEAQTRLATLETGESAFIDLLPFADIQRMKDDSRYTVTKFLLPGMPQMNYLNTRIAPTNELAVRQAINYATDKQAIIDVVYFGLTEPAYGPLSRTFPEYDPTLESLYPYDPEKAKMLLEEAGWIDTDGDGIREKNGKQLSVTIVENKSWNDWVYMMQALLQDVGFDAEVLTTQGPSNTAAISSAEYAVPAMGDVFANVTEMTRDWHSNGYGTFPSGHFWDDPTLDAMLEAAEIEIDLQKRTSQYQELQHYIMNNALMVPVFELYFYAAHANDLHNFMVDATGYYKYFAGAYFAQ